DFSKARFVIATEHPTLDPNTARTLLESGKGLAMLYLAAFPLGGNWDGSDNDYRSLHIEKNAAFLEGYAADLDFLVQSESYAFSIAGDYPPGWTAFAKDDNHKTAFYREHASGGKGAIFTYNPQFYTEIGENVLEKIIEWVAKPPIIKGVTVPEGNVAFVTPWMTDIGLRLTSREMSVQDRLKALGYQITYVPLSKLAASDLSKAKFIIGVEYPSFDAETINFLLETGKGVMLLYDAAAPLAREWESSSSGTGYKLLVSKGEAFLVDYEMDTSLDVQSDGEAGYIPKGYPLGWTIVGKNTEDIAHMTTFYKQHTSGGRGAIFTYDAEHYTEKGEEIFEKIIEWVSQALPDQVPATPVLSSPTYGSIIGTDTPTLKWLPVGGATSYTVRIATDSEFTDFVIEQSDITTTQYAVPSGKLKDKIYYWKVNASNSAGTGAWSNRWAFSKASGVPVVSVSTFTLSLDSGLNMLSLPVKPETPFTARSFAEKLGATLVIRYDTQGDEFIPFVPEAFGGDGFGIEGGQGYIVNLLESKEVAFTGSVWTQAPAKRLSTVSSNDNSTWAFVVCGAITSSQTPDALIISVENVRTGASSKAVVGQLESDRYAAAFVNLSRKGVIKSGDVLDITLRDVADRIVSGPIRYAVTPSDIMTGYAKVSMQIGDIIPNRTALLQNYPNPFNPETWIPYQLAQKENVTISIYNISGQLVRILNLGRREAGLYLSRGQAAYWDGQSDIGEQTASGVYFYTIEAGGFRATRRLVVIR
ncbi:MAG: T9SS type A sorting domain-containing protein, partial [Chloroflexi bacterium]|nr:T9SS type A sorting domain-containing protein [Chloroflexota bacterium]